MKLELKHLAPYLPYELKIPNRNPLVGTRILDSDIENSDEIVNIGACIRLQYKPILIPLSDFFENVDGVSFSNMITHGYHNSFWHKDNFNVKHLMYHDFQLLVSKHADVFGLIEKGLAINRNTIIDDIINEDNEIDNFSDRFHPNN